jgi:DNA-binding response OmpR family regulator
VKLVINTRFDLVLLDVNLPGYDGFEVLARIREGGLPVRVLMLTARSEVGDRVAGLKAGADDYLTKPFAMEELLARVDVLGRRNVAPEPETILQVGDLCMDLGRRKVSRGGKKIELSPREFEVLNVFMKEPGRAFSRDEICERIWEREHEYDTRTVEIFIMRLRKKLDFPGEDSVIRTIRSVGYMMRTSP